MRKNKTIFCLVLFGILSILFYVYSKNTLIVDNDSSILALEENNLVKEEKELSETKENNIIKLREEYQNDDIKAVLRILGTTKEWVIPQGKDNKFYLRHLLNGEYDHNGIPFLDNRTNISNSKKLLIYGHNSSKYEMPFKEIENYVSKDYFKKHPYLELETESALRRFQVFSVYVETKDFSYYNKVKFQTDDDFYRHIKALKDKSFYNTGVSIDKNDKILILQTCSTLSKYQNLKKKYLLVIAKEVS